MLSAELGPTTGVVQGVSKSVGETTFSLFFFTHSLTHSLTPKLPLSSFLPQLSSSIDPSSRHLQRPLVRKELFKGLSFPCTVPPLGTTHSHFQAPNLYHTHITHDSLPCPLALLPFSSPFFLSPAGTSFPLLHFSFSFTLSHTHSGVSFLVETRTNTSLLTKPNLPSDHPPPPELEPLTSLSDLGINLRNVEKE